MLIFMAAVFFLIVTPGPGVLSTAGVGAAYGFKAGLRYVLGLFIGTNLVALTAITGIAAVVLSVPVVRTVLMVLSVAYLTYLAAKIAFAGSKMAFIEARSAPGIKQGLLLQAINPKAYSVNIALFSGFAFAPENLIAEAGLKLVIIALIWAPIHLGWLYFGVAVHRLDLAERTQRKINYAMALSMMLVVGLAVFSMIRGV
ncbi:LysE family translocator [Pacificibacter marinus]|uniref:Leucine efflux protein n=1 Tax=Pacificibacter marinus TaxID=658057 RepID=A0A1Y5TS99_9RHOB|nr:LysE family translocator [Pacificibacter marinus]SEL33674.1 Threonine/homoserine/homoserine lactone efflux protein [Pacificibacter marinus]SLN68439.1 Leucine efflux protein [Pacificibacter marinus]